MLEAKDLEALKNVETVFLDDGGVMNDNRLRGPEWVRLIGEFLPPRLGGTAEAWGYHNQRVIRPVLEELYAKPSPFVSHRDFQQAYATRWMTAMCEAVGVPLPADLESMHHELSVFVLERANSEFAGAADAVRSLRDAGYRLYTASGGASWELRAIMRKMGIVELFTTLYGADLIDRVKYGPAYYELVFADAGVEPSRVLVVDSDLDCCEWAREAGAKAVWVDHDGLGEMPSLAALVDAMLQA